MAFGYNELHPVVELELGDYVLEIQAAGDGRKEKNE
jgi:hypothetical protein